MSTTQRIALFTLPQSEKCGYEQGWASRADNVPCRGRPARLVRILHKTRTRTCVYLFKVQLAGQNYVQGLPPALKEQEQLPPASKEQEQLPPPA